MNKTKTILIAGGAVSAVLVIAAGVFAYLAFDKASVLSKAVDSDKSKLKAINNKRPFPDGDNIAIEKENGAEYERRFGLITNILTRGAIEIPQDVTSGGFPKIAAETVKELYAAAPRDGGGNAIVNNTFYFGFGEYDEGKGVSPNRNEVPRLLKQLKLIELLTREIYGAGVLSLEEISRGKFDKAGINASGGGGSIRSSFRGGGKTSSASGSVSIPTIPPENSVENAPVPMTRERFGFKFKTRESGLVNLLNRLNSFEPFLIVNHIEFTKDNSDVVFPAPKDPTADIGKTITTVDGATITINRPPEAGKPISGPSLESPITVVLVVDVYDFNDTPAADERGEY